MISVDLNKMKKIVQNFKNKRVLVLGDLMLDKYIWGHVSLLSWSKKIHPALAEQET